LKLDSKFEYNYSELVNRNREILKDFIDINQSIRITVLSSISSALGLLDMERFEKSHGSNTLTNSMIAFNKHPKHNSTDPDLGHNTHTDFGSIAVLYAPQ
jgi:isopenicillin N synthase-like dioxygenase